jgi:hypothetical protein
LLVASCRKGSKSEAQQKERRDQITVGLAAEKEDNMVI